MFNCLVIGVDTILLKTPKFIETGNCAILTVVLLRIVRAIRTCSLVFVSWSFFIYSLLIITIGRLLWAVWAGGDGEDGGARGSGKGGASGEWSLSSGTRRNADFIAESWTSCSIADHRAARSRGRACPSADSKVSCFPPLLTITTTGVIGSGGRRGGSSRCWFATLTSRVRTS